MFEFLKDFEGSKPTFKIGDLLFFKYSYLFPNQLFLLRSSYFASVTIGLLLS